MTLTQDDDHDNDNEERKKTNQDNGKGDKEGKRMTNRKTMRTTTITIRAAMIRFEQIGFSE